MLDENSTYAYLLLCHHFHETCRVAQREGDIVGFVTAYRPPLKPDTLFVWQVAVAEAMRGQGLASRLIAAVLDSAACAGVRYLEASISPSNIASQQLFFSLARRTSVECRVSPLFPAELFGDALHESEELYRIGPLDRPPGEGALSTTRKGTS